MKPKELAAKAKRDRSQVDMSIYEGGSASLRNVRKSLDAKREAHADAAAAVEGRKAARAGKQAVVSAAAEQLVADYERCAAHAARSPVPGGGHERLPHLQGGCGSNRGLAWCASAWLLGRGLTRSATGRAWAAATFRR